MSLHARLPLRFELGFELGFELARGLVLNIFELWFALNGNDGRGRTYLVGMVPICVVWVGAGALLLCYCYYLGTGLVDDLSTSSRAGGMVRKSTPASVYGGSVPERIQCMSTFWRRGAENVISAPLISIWMPDQAESFVLHENRVR